MRRHQHPAGEVAERCDELVPRLPILLRRNDVEVRQRHRDDLDGQRPATTHATRRRDRPGPQPSGQQHAQRSGHRGLGRHRDVGVAPLVEPGDPRRRQHADRARGEVAVDLGRPLRPRRLGVARDAVGRRAPPPPRPPDTANGTSRSSYQNAHSQRRDHDWVGSCSTTYRAYQPPVSRLPTRVDATTPTPSVAVAPTPTPRRRTRSHSSIGAATSSAFCLVRNASSSTAPSPTPPRQVRARIPTKTAARSSARKQGVDARGVGERAADAVGRGVEPAADDPRDGAAPGPPHDERPGAARTARLATTETTRIVVRSTPVTLASAPVSQK